MPFPDSQKVGSLLVAALATVSYALHISKPYLKVVDDPLYLKEKQGYVLVELKSELGPNGIYYLPQGTRLAEFLESVNIKDFKKTSQVALPLIDGASYHIYPEGEIRTTKIPNTKRRALGKTIDINEASQEDLVSIPGIGEKRAGRILQFRVDKGRIEGLNELKEIGGIKRLDELKKYLHVERR